MSIVIFLHGTSSSGKTSIAKLLQEQIKTPLLHFGIDTLLSMLPEKSLGSMPSAENAYYFEMTDGVVQKVKLGVYAQRLICTTIPVVEELLFCENDLVVDEILSHAEMRDKFLFEYAKIFAHHTAYFIKVYCPLEELERRESKRPDRHRGIARLQFDAIHAHGFAYDFTVDTSQKNPEECAQSILNFMAEQKAPIAFQKIRDAIK